MLTPTEKHALQAIATAGEATTGEAHEGWWSAEILMYAKECTLSPSSFAGACGSLAKKGLTISSDCDGQGHISITPAGMAALKAPPAFSEPEMIATIFHSFRAGHATGSFGSAVAVEPSELYPREGTVRVEVLGGPCVLVNQEGDFWLVSFKNFVSQDKDLEHAARMALEAGRDVSATSIRETIIRG